MRTNTDFRTLKPEPILARNPRKVLARPAGLEPATPGLEGRAFHVEHPVPADVTSLAQNASTVPHLRFPGKALLMSTLNRVLWTFRSYRRHQILKRLFRA